MTDSTPIEETMTATVVTTTPETTVGDAAATLLEEDIGSLLVVDEHDELIGVVTATDFLSDVAAGEVDSSVAVTEYATTDVVTIDRDSSVGTAAARMITTNVQHLPITDEADEIVGIVSAADLTGSLSYTGTDGTE